MNFSQVTETDNIMSTTSQDYEKYVEIRTITEWKDGCIYKTVHNRFEWVPMDTPMYSVQNNEQVCNLSTAKMRELNYNTIRRISSK